MLSKVLRRWLGILAKADPYELALLEREILSGIVAQSHRNLSFICMKEQLRDTLAYRPESRPRFVWAQAGYRSGSKSRGPKWLEREWDETDGSVEITFNPPHNIWWGMAKCSDLDYLHRATFSCEADAGPCGTCTVTMRQHLRSFRMSGFDKTELDAQYPERPGLRLGSGDFSDDWNTWKSKRDHASGRLSQLGDIILRTIADGTFKEDIVVASPQGHQGAIKGIPVTGAYAELLAFSDGLNVNHLELYRSNQCEIQAVDAGGKRTMIIGHLGEISYSLGLGDGGTTDELYYHTPRGKGVKRFKGDILDLCLHQLKGESALS